MKRLNNLTGIRAFGCFWVVLYHLQVATHLGVRMGTFGQRGALGVDIFFVLSGFVLSLVYASKLEPKSSSTTFWNYLVRRFAKLYPLHLLTFLMFVALYLLARQFNILLDSKTEYTLFSALLNILMLNALGFTHGLSWNFVSWSVGAEWFAYSVVFVPMVRSMRSIQAGPVLVFSVILWIGYIMFCDHVLHSTIELTSLGAVRILPEFFFGYSAYRLIRGAKIKLGDVYTVCGILSFFLIALLPFETSGWVAPAALLLIIGCYSGGTMTNKLFGNRLVVLIGEGSYSTYLFHPFLIVAVNIAVKHFHWKLSVASANSAGIFLALVMTGVGYLSFVFLEDPARVLVINKLSRESVLREKTKAAAADAAVS